VPVSTPHLGARCSGLGRLLRFWGATTALILLAGCGDRGPGAASVPAPAPAVDRSALEVADGIFRVKGTTNLFTGRLQEVHTNGVVRSEASVKDGRLDGLVRGYHPSGILQVEEPYVDGLSHGTRRRFHEDGTPKSIEEIREGRLHGRYERFHPTGAVAERGAFVDGQPEGLAESWDASGRWVARVQFEGGRVVHQEFNGQGAVAAAVPASAP
jgi:antitoxin component YwqK of YwqJK toxin-antitoxin module